MAAQPVVCVEAIEAAIIVRLRAGLGRMVRQVDSYGGEFDDGLPQVIRQFPAAWVTFAGVMGTRPQSTSRVRYIVRGRFVVMVGDRSVRAAASRRGTGDPGTYTLQHAVRRLLANQDLGLDGVDVLQPGAVRTLFNGTIQSHGFSIFACEFDTAWREEPLPVGHWPSPDASNPDDPDTLFATYQGQLDPPYPEMTHVRLDHRLSTTASDEAPDASDLVTLKG